MRSVLVMLLLAGCAAAAERSPNVLLILTDDMGWGDLRCHGNEQIDTPNLDRLAKESVRFTNFHVSPLCAPTRASLLTGRYHLRTGVQWVSASLETMRANEWTIAEALGGAGYATGCFGKWHNGGYYPHDAIGQGFETFVGFRGGHLTVYYDPSLERGRTPIRPKGYITDILTDEAIAFVRKHREKPFLCYVPYNAPHAPFQLADGLYDKYRKRGFDEKTASVYGMVENVDANVGRLLRTLEEEKLDRDTIVLFLTDNGPNGARYNGGMRGTKGNVHEGGTRVPLFVRWTGHLKPRDVKEVTAHIDVLPTLLDLCGVKAKPPLSVDGVNLRPLLDGTVKEWADRPLFVNNCGRVLRAYPGAVRTRQHRLIVTAGHVELYDMLSDPAQKHDVARAQPEVTARLRKAYEAWYKEVTREKVGPPPIPVGYEQAPVVELEAVDASLKGGMQFIGKMGWAHDWITGWTKSTDQATWEIDVVRDGAYEVALTYTCSKGDVGARVEVEVAGRKLEGRVAKEHDPLPRKGPDRVPRGEVVEKTWLPLTLGTVTLAKGRGQVVVRALDCPGKQVMDLKAVRLRRVDEKRTP